MADLATLALRSSQLGGASQGAQALAVGQQLLTQLQTTEPVGRLVINLLQVLAAQTGDTADVVMRDGDCLLVPNLSLEVTVLGEVQNATSYFYRNGISRDECISMVARQSSGWFSPGSVDIRPGNTVVAPVEAGRIRPLTPWTSVTQILYNVAIAAAAIASF